MMNVMMKFIIMMSIAIMVGGVSAGLFDAFTSCNAQTPSGRKCRNARVPGSDYCEVHKCCKCLALAYHNHYCQNCESRPKCIWQRCTEDGTQSYDAESNMQLSINGQLIVSGSYCQGHYKRIMESVKDIMESKARQDAERIRYERLIKDRDFTLAGIAFCSSRNIGDPVVQIKQVKFGPFEEVCLEYGENTQELIEARFISKPYGSLKELREAFVNREVLWSVYDHFAIPFTVSAQPRDRRGTHVTPYSACGNRWWGSFGGYSFTAELREQSGWVAELIVRHDTVREKDERFEKEKERREAEEQQAAIRHKEEMKKVELVQARKEKELRKEARRQEVYQAAIKAGRREELLAKKASKKTHDKRKGEKPDSFFEFPLGEQIPVDLEGPVGLPVLGIKTIEPDPKVKDCYLFYPEKKFRCFEKYYVRLSPISHKVEWIVFQFDESSKKGVKIPQNEYFTIRDILEAKYGQKAENSGNALAQMMAGIPTAESATITFEDGSRVFVKEYMARGEDAIWGLVDEAWDGSEDDLLSKRLKVVFVDEVQTQAGKKEREEEKKQDVLKNHKADAELL